MATTRKSGTKTGTGVDVDPSAFPVRDGEDPWTADEITEVMEELEADKDRQHQLIAQAEQDLVGLREGSEGAGRDTADIGFNNFERDQEISLVHAAREALDQNEQALRAIRRGQYGRCENCEQPIGKGRLQVFPRATMCVACKQRTERR